jgi:hypothetical protein
MTGSISKQACKLACLVPRFGLSPVAKDPIQKMNPWRHPKSASRFAPSLIQKDSFGSISGIATFSL